MPLDIAVLDDDYRYKKHIHLDKMIHGVLFKKLVTEKDYPSLGRAADESEDITITPEELPAFKADVVKLEKYLKKEKLMSEEVKGRCLAFVLALKEICVLAGKEKRNVEFVAGE